MQRAVTGYYTDTQGRHRPITKRSYRHRHKESMHLTPEEDAQLEQLVTSLEQNKNPTILSVSPAAYAAWCVATKRCSKKQGEQLLKELEAGHVDFVHIAYHPNGTKAATKPEELRQAQTMPPLNHNELKHLLHLHIKASRDRT